MIQHRSVLSKEKEKEKEIKKLSGFVGLPESKIFLFVWAFICDNKKCGCSISK